MTSGYEDIVAIAKKLGLQPSWFDEHGVPRYVDHHPKYCPDIYAREVVLLEIACQRCETRLRVQMSTGQMDEIMARVKEHPFSSLADQIKSGIIHYGDPPHHDTPDTKEFCHAGCTMNCYDIQVLEYWYRSNSGWSRVAELEIALPDTKEIADV